MKISVMTKRTLSGVSTGSKEQSDRRVNVQCNACQSTVDSADVAEGLSVVYGFEVVKDIARCRKTAHELATAKVIIRDADAGDQRFLRATATRRAGRAGGAGAGAGRVW
jgi:hypothetical protein